MPNWNELFLNKNNIQILPQIEVLKFIKKLEGFFTERPLKIWDQCCGAGRHVVFISKLGHKVYGSDISENGINYLKNWLKVENCKAELKIGDMITNPWNDEKFHGIICWDALHHNKLENIIKAEEIIYLNTLEQGMFLLTLISTKSDRYRKGTEIEENTFMPNDGLESGVPHHYFNEQEIRIVFKKWKFLILAEQIIDYIEKESEFYKTNPYPYTKWLLLLQK